jgi:hypothetical protein
LPTLFDLVEKAAPKQMGSLRSQPVLGQPGLSEAHHVAKIDLVNNRLVPTAMEARAALAEYEPATEDFTQLNFPLSRGSCSGP